MPYVFAHPAAVVPVARLLGRSAVPSALVIGSMIPDAWYVVPLVQREHSHSLLGLLWFCLPAGLIAYAAFHLVFKEPLLAVFPRNLAGRLAAWTTTGLPHAPWGSVLLSFLAGAATHVAWDACTHPGPVPILRTMVLPGVHLNQVLQHGSTLLGTAFLAWWLWRKLRSTAPKRATGELQPSLRVAVLTTLVLVPTFAFFSVVLAFDLASLREGARAGAVRAVCTFALLALVFCLAWRRWLRARWAREGR